MKKILASASLFLLTYLYGFLSGVIFHLFRLLTIIGVRHYERFPQWGRKIVLVSNHPSLLEPLILPALFFPGYILYPNTLAPWSTPDRSNFYDRWYWFWARPRTVPVDRSDEGKEARSGCPNEKYS